MGLVSRDICARSNTFLLESVRPAQPGDCDSLVLVRNGSQTTIRYGFGKKGEFKTPRRPRFYVTLNQSTHRSVLFQAPPVRRHEGRQAGVVFEVEQNPESSTSVGRLSFVGVVNEWKNIIKL